MEHDPVAALERVDAWTRRRPWVGELLLAGALAVVLLPMSLTLLRGSDASGAQRVVLTCLLVVLHLVVVLRRRAPVAAFLVVAAAELALALAPLLGGLDATGTTYPAVLLPSSLVYLVGAYSVSAHAGRPWPSVSLAVGAVGALLVAARAAAGTPRAVGGTGELVFLGGALLAAVLAAWALGRFRRVRADQVLALAERARRAEADRELRDRQAAAEERGRIARELHDVIAHSVSVMVRQAEGGRYVAARDPAAAAAALATIADTGRTALTDMRSMLGVLDAGDGASAGTGPQPTLDDLPDLVERVRASGQPVRLRVEGAPQPLDRAAHLAAYRLVQEALTNVVKHAGPDVEAAVTLSWSPRALRLEVTDSGGPARPATGNGPDGRGLVGMRERLQLVGGRLSAGPAPAGFAVVGEIPTAGPVGGRPR
ncbi:sensor histidine kinase [Blastococcus sp. SYSU D00669]